MEKVLINPKVESSWPFKKILFLKLVLKRELDSLCYPVCFLFKLTCI